MNDDIDIATKALTRRAVPDFVKFFVERVSKSSDLASLNVPSLLHRFGIFSSSSSSLLFFIKKWFNAWSLLKESIYDISAPQFVRWSRTWRRMNLLQVRFILGISCWVNHLDRSHFQWSTVGQPQCCCSLKPLRALWKTNWTNSFAAKWESSSFPLMCVELFRAYCAVSCADSLVPTIGPLPKDLRSIFKHNLWIKWRLPQMVERAASVSVEFILFFDVLSIGGKCDARFSVGNFFPWWEREGDSLHENMYSFSLLILLGKLRWFVDIPSGKMTGLQFSVDANKRFSGLSKWNYREPFGLLDLVDMGEIVKNMDIISSSQGTFYYFKSLQEADPNISLQYLEQVCIHILFLVFYHIMMPTNFLR